MAGRVVVLLVPNLRMKDVTPGGLASLDRLGGRGGEAELLPIFPSLTASSFASMITGTGPSRHGIVGNAFFDPVHDAVRCPPLVDEDIQAARLWDVVRRVRPDSRSMLWFTPLARGASVNWKAWIDSDGNLATEPAGLAADLAGRLGAFPSKGATGRFADSRLAVSTWVLRSAARMLAEHRPDLAIIRVPYLSQAARRHGPESREASRAVRELEAVLKPFLESLDKDTTVLVVTDTVVTRVDQAIAPNRELREAGLLATGTDSSGALVVDLERSEAFAVADHQICHVYVKDSANVGVVASLFSGANEPGVSTVLASRTQRAAVGLDHPRAGDVMLVAHPDAWFSPEWWFTAAERSRLRSDMPGWPLAWSSAISVVSGPFPVMGSTGAPPASEDDLGVILCSRPDVLPSPSPARLALRDVGRIVLALLDLDPNSA